MRRNKVSYDFKQLKDLGKFFNVIRLTVVANTKLLHFTKFV